MEQLTLVEHLAGIKDATINFLVIHEQQQTFALNLANKKRVNPYDKEKDTQYKTLSRVMVEASNAGYKAEAYQCYHDTRRSFYSSK